MKRGLKLTALLLALAMLLCTAAAYAEGEGIPFEDMSAEGYALIVAGAQDASTVIGRKAKTNHANVAVYDWIGALKKDTITDAGTVVEIIGVGIRGWKYEVKYTKENQEKTGYIYKSELSIVYEIEAEPWDETQTTATLSFAADGAASYVWERGVISEDGSVIWETEPIATGADLTLETDVYGDFSALQYTYRCVAKSKSGETVGISENTTLVRADIAAWLANGEISSQMLTRALNAPSLDSMVLESTSLMHVRTGEAYAYHNTITNALIDAKTGDILGYVVDGMLYTPQ